MNFSVKTVIVTVLTVLLVFTMSVTAMAEVGDFSFSASRVVDVYPDDPETGDEGAEFTVRFSDRSGNRLDDEDIVFHVSSNRDTEELELADDIVGSVDVIDREAWKIDATTNDDGEIIFEVTSDFRGSATIEVGEYDEDDREMVSKIDDGSQEIRFGSEKITDLNLSVDNRTPRVGDDFTLTVEAFDGNFEANEGLDIIIEEEKDGEDFEELETKETDEDGTVELTLDRTELADYRYKAIYEGEDEDIESNYRTVSITETGNMDRIEFYEDTKFVESGRDSFEVYLALYDEYDNKITDSDKINISIEDPDGEAYDRDDRAISLAVDEENEDSETYNMFVIEVDLDRIDLLGEFEIEAMISGTTIGEWAQVNVADFGELDDIELELSKDAAVIDEADDDDYYAEVTLIDETGLEKDYVTNNEDIVFSTEDYSVASIGSTSGDITIRGEGVTEFTAYHQEKGFEDTASLSVGSAATDLEIETDIEPGALEGEVEMRFIGEEGQRAPGEGGYIITGDNEVTVTNQNDFDSGLATFDVEADSYGSYELRAITDEGFSKNFEVVFSEEEDDEEYDLTIVVEDEDGSTIEGAQVTIDGDTYETDMIGYAEIGTVDSGYHSYTVEADGFEAYDDSLTLYDDTEEVVTLTEEETTTERDITMTLDEQDFTVDGEEETFEVAPRAIDGRTFLPFRAIGETLGAYVEYDQSDQSVTAMRDDRTVVFYLGEETAKIDGEDYEMDAAPFVDDDLGRTLLPLRFFAEAFDAYVDYDQATQKVTIQE